MIVVPFNLYTPYNACVEKLGDDTVFHVERNARDEHDACTRQSMRHTPDTRDVDGGDSAAAVARALAVWWSGHARDLPWRFGRTTAWGVLVSEVMSQQTQMSRVVPYWQAWMATWPDARSLSAASTAEVITAWGRLGYPRRALRLQECARVVAEQYGNVLPHSYDELISLPGIGNYTASAVMSFAFGERIAVIDTNIRRVLSRVFLGQESLGGSATKQERALAQEVLPQDATDIKDTQNTSVLSVEVVHNTVTEDQTKSSRQEHKHPSVIWNQSVMELGALVCTAKTPDCQLCPIREVCQFYAAGLPGLGEKRTRPRQRFQGTDRQVRGIILHALRDAPAHELPRNAIHQLWDNVFQLDECLASLDNDGLIELCDNNMVRLPQ